MEAMVTEEESARLEEVHEFLFRPPVTNGTPRAQQFDELWKAIDGDPEALRVVLRAVALVRTIARVILWICGAIAALAVAAGQWKSIKDLIP